MAALHIKYKGQQALLNKLLPAAERWKIRSAAGIFIIKIF